MGRRAWMVWLLLLGCGPAIVPGGESQGGSGSSATGPTGAGDVTATASGGLDGTTSVGTTSADGSSDDTTTGLDDPTGPCPDPIAGVTFLWCGELDPEGPLAAVDGWVYFDTADESLWRVPWDGGDAQGLAGGLGDLFDLEVVVDRVYFVSFFAGRVGWVPTEGGPAVLYSEELFKPNSIAIADGFAVVTQYGAGLPMLRYDISLAPLEEPVELYAGLDYAGHVLAEGSSLLFATSTNDGNVPTPVLRGDTAGGPLQEIIAPVAGIEDLVTERTNPNLWWLRYVPDDSAIMYTSAGGSSTELVYQPSAHPLDLAVTSSRAYWREHTYSGDTPYQERLQSVLRTGDEPQLHVVADQVGPVVATPVGIVSTLQQGTLGAVMLLEP